MSRSRTYRRVALTDEEYADIVARTRQERFKCDLFPALRSELERSANRLRLSGAASTRVLSMLEGRLKTVETLEEFRTIAVSMGRLKTETLGLPQSRLAGEPACSSQCGPVDLAGLQFDLMRLGHELDSIDRTAAELHLELSEQDLAHREALVATELVRTRDASQALLAVERLQELVELLDLEIDDALASAECRAKTVFAVVNILGSMGYSAAESVVRDDVTVVFARTGDGRKARVEVSDIDQDIECASTFMNSADAVRDDHPDSGSVCESAVLDQAAFHRGIERTPGLRTGQVTAAERPTRGSGTRAAGHRSSRRSNQFDQTRAQHREL